MTNSNTSGANILLSLSNDHHNKFEDVYVNVPIDIGEVIQDDTANAKTYAE